MELYINAVKRFLIDVDHYDIIKSVAVHCLHNSVKQYLDL